MAIFISGGVGGSSTVTTTGQNSSSGGTTTTTYSSTTKPSSSPSTSSSSSSGSSSSSSGSSGGYKGTGYRTYAEYKNAQNDIQNEQFKETYGYAPRTTSEMNEARNMYYSSTSSSASSTISPQTQQARVPLTQAQVEQYQALASKQESYVPLEQDESGNYYYARGSEKEKMQEQEAKNLAQGYRMTSTTSSSKYISPKQEELVYESNIRDLVFDQVISDEQNKYTAYEDASGGVYLPIEYYGGVPETPLTSSQKGQLGYVDVGYTLGPHQITILAQPGTERYNVAKSVIEKTPSSYGQTSTSSGVYLVGPTIPQEKEVTQQATALAEQTSAPKIAGAQEGDVYASIESFYAENSGEIALNTPRSDGAVQLFDTVRTPDVKGTWIIQNGEMKPYADVVPPKIIYTDLNTGETSRYYEIPTNVYEVTTPSGEKYKTTQIPVDSRIQAEFEKTLDSKTNPTGAVWLNSPYEAERYNEAQLNKRVEEFFTPVYEVAESLRVETSKRWPVVGGVMGETTYGWVTAVPETAKLGVTSLYKMGEANPMTTSLSVWDWDTSTTPKWTKEQRAEAGRQIFFEDTALTGVALGFGAVAVGSKIATNPMQALTEYGPIALVVVPRAVGGASFFMGASATIAQIQEFRRTIGFIEYAYSYEPGYTRTIKVGNMMGMEVYGPSYDMSLTMQGVQKHQVIETILGKELPNGGAIQYVIPKGATSLTDVRTIIYEPATQGVDYGVWGADINKIKDITRQPITQIGIAGKEYRPFTGIQQNAWMVEDLTTETYKGLISSNYEVGQFIGGGIGKLDTRSSAMVKLAGREAWVSKGDFSTYAYTGYEFKGITSVDITNEGFWIQSTTKPEPFIANVYQKEIGKGTYYFMGGSQPYSGEMSTFKGVLSVMEKKATDITPLNIPSFGGAVVKEGPKSTFIDIVGKQGLVSKQIGNLAMPLPPSSVSAMSGGVTIAKVTSVSMPIPITSYSASPVSVEVEDVYTEVRTMPSISSITGPRTAQITEPIVKLPTISPTLTLMQEPTIRQRQSPSTGVLTEQLPVIRQPTSQYEVQITEPQTRIRPAPIQILNDVTIPEFKVPNVPVTGFGKGGGGEVPPPPKIPVVEFPPFFPDINVGNRGGFTFKQKTIYKPSYVGSGLAPGFPVVNINKAPKVLTGGEIRGIVKKKRKKKMWYEKM